jgi:hypothetical protein
MKKQIQKQNNKIINKRKKIDGGSYIRAVQEVVAFDLLALVLN